jgi:hypothetical protein
MNAHTPYLQCLHQPTIIQLLLLLRLVIKHHLLSVPLLLSCCKNACQLHRQSVLQILLVFKEVRQYGAQLQGRADDHMISPRSTEPSGPGMPPAPQQAAAAAAVIRDKYKCTNKHDGTTE